jgi:putative Mg2+ transporter-C (MgtC) family protein
MQPVLTLPDFIAANAEPLLKLVLSAALGGMIGLEREASGKPAGFRTNLLICVGAALVTDISMLIARDITLPGGIRADPARLAAQIVSGIGFLGAGTILQSRGSVSGLTTAATLWVVAAIGIAVGAEAYVQAVAATVLVILSLMILGRLDDHLLPRRRSERTLRITLAPRPELVGEIEHQLVSMGYQVRSLDVEKRAEAIVLTLGARGAGGDYGRAIQVLLERDGVDSVSLS